MSNGPLFSVVLPVRNGGEYVKLCVASVLAQTLSDAFELLVLDNASTDGTAEWLATLDDPRVRVFPSDRPLAIEENWARIKDLPKKKFLTTIGHDDLLDARFLEIIARLIRAAPDAGLYYTHFRLIGADGAFLRHCRPMPARETAAEFLAARLRRRRDSFGTGHVLRSAAYDALGGIPPFPKLLYADDALFLRAIGASYRATAPDEAFSYRWHAASTSTGSTWEGVFAGLERYGQFLACLAGADPALTEVLRNDFLAHATAVCLLWKRERLLAARRARTVPDPSAEAWTDRRIAQLVFLFGGPAVPVTPSTREIRLLQSSFHSKTGRVLYEAWRVQRRCRDAVARWLTRAELP